jgi:cell division protein FtsQ
MGARRNKRLKEPFFKRAKRFFACYLKLTLVILAVPLAGISGFLAYREVTTTKYLAVSSVNITGANHASKKEVLEAVGIGAGQNILSFSAKGAEEKLKKSPWIFSASVKRRYPGTVDIFIQERVPAALVRMDELFLMDESGIIFKKASREDAMDLPVITGLNADFMSSGGLQEGFMDLLGVLRTRKGFNAQAISEIHIDPVYGFSIYTLEDGVRLDVGLGNFEEKLVNFERVAGSRGGVLQGIETMDLTRSPEAIVRFKSKVLKEGGAI